MPVYIIQSGDRPLVKVGWTAGDPMRRMQDFQSGNPDQLRLLHVVECDEGFERVLHKRFAHLSVHGEWFELRGSLADYCVSLEPCDRTCQARKKRTAVVHRLRTRKSTPEIDALMEHFGCQTDDELGAVVGQSAHAVEKWRQTGRVPPLRLENFGAEAASRGKRLPREIFGHWSAVPPRTQRRAA